MCGRTCVGVTSGKKDRTHALRTHVLEFISHAHAHVRPHIARTFATHTLLNANLECILPCHLFAFFKGEQSEEQSYIVDTIWIN